MLLAELEVFHSRPIAPTRRVALGATVLPATPTPGFGGLLLGGVVAAFIADVDPELTDELLTLSHQLAAGRRIPQPRLRHRFQDDRVGLSRFRHRLIGDGDELRFDIDTNGSAAPNVLAAFYAAARVGPEHVDGVFRTLRRAVHWRGPGGAKLIAHLSDSRVTTDWAKLGGADPVVWALAMLGLDASTVDSISVQRQFRVMLRQAHPDHGGAVDSAARRISDLTDARRILLNDAPANGAATHGRVRS